MNGVIVSVPVKVENVGNNHIDATLEVVCGRVRGEEFPKRIEKDSMTYALTFLVDGEVACSYIMTEAEYVSAISGHCLGVADLGYLFIAGEYFLRILKYHSDYVEPTPSVFNRRTYKEMMITTSIRGGILRAISLACQHPTVSQDGYSSGAQYFSSNIPLEVRATMAKFEVRG